MSATTLVDMAREELDEAGGSLDADQARLALDLVHQVLAVRRTGRLEEGELDWLARALRARLELPPGAVERLVALVSTERAEGPIRPEELRVLVAQLGEAAARTAVEGAEHPGDLRDFARRHGVAESLLLLDLLVQVGMADGTVNPAELTQLEDAARQLGVDPVFVSALLSKHDPRMATTGKRVRLQGRRVRIGRSTTNDLVLPDPSVAARHAELVLVENQWRAMAVGRRPVLVDGRAVASAPLPLGAKLRIGPYLIDQAGSHLVVHDERRFSALTVRELTRCIGQVPILQDISFTAFSGELIAVVGPSGSGKTTLMGAISGLAPADHGDVLLDGDPLHGLLVADPTLAGEVPQDDIVLPELTVEESLRASARLRFAGDVDAATIDAAVDRVLDELGIADIRGARIGDAEQRGISGGQRKRVNLGQELLTRSTRLLFLDEPLSGLDPAASHDIVGLLRRLADQGRILFLVTHDLSAPVLDQVDHLLVMDRGGRLAWFGPPAEAVRWFQVSSPGAIIDRLDQDPPGTWVQRWEGSEPARRYVATREYLLHLRPEHAGTGPSGRRKPPYRSTLRSLATLLQRTALVKARDRSGLLMLLGQPMLVAAVIGLAFSRVTSTLLFVTSLACLWFGMSASVRELLVDRVVWKRERRVGLGVLPYLGSKVLVLGAVTAAQAAFLAAASHLLTGMGALGFSLPLLALVAVLTAWVGVGTGLLVSALTRSSTFAVGALVMFLVPQIVFSGIMLPLDEVHAPARALSWLTAQRYAFDAALKTGERLEYDKHERCEGEGRADMGWQERPVRGELYALGLRADSEELDDQGIPLPVLGLVLLGAAVLLLGGATWRVWSRDRLTASRRGPRSRRRSPGHP